METKIYESVHLLQIFLTQLKNPNKINTIKNDPYISLNHKIHVERPIDKYQTGLPQLCWKLSGWHQKNLKLPKIVSRNLDPSSAEISENFNTQTGRRISIRITKCVIEIRTL